MRVSRRHFVQRSMPGAVGATQVRGQIGNGVPVRASITSLKPLPSPAPPITNEEWQARIA